MSSTVRKCGLPTARAPTSTCCSPRMSTIQNTIKRNMVEQRHSSLREDSMDSLLERKRINSESDLVIPVRFFLRTVRSL